MNIDEIGRRALTGASKRLLRCVDFGLAGVVFVLPFCMGGRQALGQFLLVALASLVAVAWTARQALSSGRQPGGPRPSNGCCWPRCCCLPCN